MGGSIRGSRDTSSEAIPDGRFIGEYGDSEAVAETARKIHSDIRELRNPWFSESSAEYDGMMPKEAVFSERPSGFDTIFDFLNRDPEASVKFEDDNGELTVELYFDSRVSREYREEVAEIVGNYLESETYSGVPSS
ncbi:hypothetical protein [Candidatus Nanohalobium constans]|uniref:Uncharacterized protein n=1 Tax=Candidatus Nanohalobium constans TaxID=2565781 RepID=A0A5Q0UF10_9ARCH|nr:hypothetical protein [Candidatus Nanohalobium constans]QGA80183.1 hypothetical protein LC1Nh_0280 [Candidatus Nanohalobium constans]